MQQQVTRVWQPLTVRHGHIQDVHLNPLAEFKGISTVDPADVKASVLQLDWTYHQVRRDTVWNLKLSN